MRDGWRRKATWQMLLFELTAVNGISQIRFEQNEFQHSDRATIWNLHLNRNVIIARESQAGTSEGGEFICAIDDVCRQNVQIFSLFFVITILGLWWSQQQRQRWQQQQQRYRWRRKRNTAKRFVCSMLFPYRNTVPSSAANSNTAHRQQNTNTIIATPARTHSSILVWSRCAWPLCAPSFFLR